MKAYKELNTCREVYTSKILNGIELNIVYDGVVLHLLCYDFDYDGLKGWPVKIITPK